MFELLETHLLAALRQVHPADLIIQVGPDVMPSVPDSAWLSVGAHRLRVDTPRMGTDIEEQRAPAFLGQQQVFAADGKQLDFDLPDGLPGQVIEVQSPPGRLARSGDDYRVEGGSIRFYRAPAEARQAVLVRVRGGRARGYQESYPCQLSLMITAWAKEIRKADRLLMPSLSAVLSTFVDLDMLSMETGEAAGATYRLLEPVATLKRIERSAEQVDDTTFYRSRASLMVSGQLELTVALGAEQPESRIEEIIYPTDSVVKD